MTSIDPRHRIAAVLLQQAGAARAGSRMAGPAAAGAGRGAGKPSGVPAAVALRIQAIAADDPGRKPKAVRIFLEATLLQELGSRLVHDAGFPAMVEAVQQAMQEDAELARAVDQLGDLLLSA